MCVRHLTPEMPARNPGQPHLWGNFFTHKTRREAKFSLLCRAYLPHFSLMLVQVAEFILHMEGICQRGHLSGVSHKLLAHLECSFSIDLCHQMSIWVCTSPKPCRDPTIHQTTLPNKTWPQKTGSCCEGSQGSVLLRGLWT